MYSRDRNAKLKMLVSTVGVIVITLFMVIIGFGYYRDIDAVIDRAQVAADREDMVEYLTDLKENMEAIGMTKGHTALIFKTPANDMALHYRAVNRILERLESIAGIPKSDTAYQVALDDIRGIVRELSNPAIGWLWVHNWFFIVLGVALCIYAFIKSADL